MTNFQFSSLKTHLLFKQEISDLNPELFTVLSVRKLVLKNKNQGDLPYGFPITAPAWGSSGNNMAGVRKARVLETSRLGEFTKVTGKGTEKETVIVTC